MEDHSNSIVFQGMHQKVRLSLKVVAFQDIFELTAFKMKKILRNMKKFKVRSWFYFGFLCYFGCCSPCYTFLVA